MPRTDKQLDTERPDRSDERRRARLKKAGDRLDEATAELEAAAKNASEALREFGQAADSARSDDPS